MKVSDYGLFFPLDYNPGDVAENVVNEMHEFFSEFGHNPSADMWDDLYNTALQIETMANGELKSGYYMNDLAPGVGKTTTIIFSVKHLLKSPKHKNVGILICVPMLDEIETLIKDMGLDKKDIGVQTGDDKVNALGCGDNDKARVLFTTQQMVERRLSSGRKFADIKEFQYLGKPRQVRLWDEAMVPWEEYTASHFDLGGASKALEYYKKPLANKLFDLAAEIKGLKEGTTYQFPDLEKEFGVTYEDLQKDISNHLEMRAIWKLSGKEVRVTKDIDDSTCLDWKPSLPEDFLPVIVFDASGRVRTIYDNMRQSGRHLETITKARKKWLSAVSSG